MDPDGKEPDPNHWHLRIIIIILHDVAVGVVVVVVVLSPLDLGGLLEGWCGYPSQLRFDQTKTKIVIINCIKVCIKIFTVRKGYVNAYIIFFNYNF